MKKYIVYTCIYEKKTTQNPFKIKSILLIMHIQNSYKNWIA